MFLGYSVLGSSFSKNVPPVKQSFSKITLQGNSIYDELHIYDVEKSDSTLLAFNTEENFDSDTTLLAHFSSSLGAGDYDSLDTPIYKYLVYKRKVGDTRYILFAEVLQESSITTIYDFSCRNNVEYEYYILPVGTDETIGSGTTLMTKLNFWGWYISDLSNENLFKFDLNIESSNIQNVLNITVQTNNTKYPKVTQGKQNYLQGSLNTVPYNTDGNTYIFDYNVLEEVRAFLLDGETKVLRNTIGEGMLVRIINCSIQHMDNIQNEHNGHPFTLNFEFVQIGEVV